MLIIPYPTRRFVVDAYADQLGCVLLQIYSIGDLHPVGYFSRALKATEQNCFTSERECLGLVWGVLSLRHFLEGKVVTVRTDEKAIRWI